MTNDLPLTALAGDTETDTALRDASRRFLADCCGWHARQAGTALDTEAAWRRMAGLGWFALGVAEAQGGLGGSSAQLLIVLEEAGRALADQPLITNVLLAPTLLARCDAALAESFMAGEARFALVHADARREALRWREHDGTLQIEGVAAPALGAPRQAAGAPAISHWIVLARHADTARPGVFLLPAATPGVHATGATLMDGSAASSLRFAGGEWAFDAATLDAGPGAAHLGDELLDRATAGAVAEAYGAADAAFRLTLDYLKQRIQFGKPLSRLQAVQHQMAEAFCSLEQQRSLLSWLPAALGGEAGTRRRAVSSAKAFLGGRTREAVETCIQLSGGIGVTDEYALGHYYKRVLVRAAMFGDADWHLTRLERLAAGGTR